MRERGQDGGKMHENVVSAKFASKDEVNQRAFQELKL